jgi:AcrR family transcriptional regulator
MTPRAADKAVRLAEDSVGTAQLRRRRQRRGDKRDPALSRQLILSAAQDEFAAYGLNGARIDRIAGRVGASKNLIYHYFGSKDRLYLNVLESIYRGMREEQDDLALQELPPVEGMRRLVANTFDSFVRSPALIRLMSIENIHLAKQEVDVGQAALWTAAADHPLAADQRTGRGRIPPERRRRRPLHLDVGARLLLPVQPALAVVDFRPAARRSQAAAATPVSRRRRHPGLSAAARLSAYLSMIFSENRYPLFGSML